MYLFINKYHTSNCTKILDITENNYIRSKGSGSNFEVEIDPLPPCANYFKESCIAAKKIEASRSGKLHILYSGGIDSEFTMSVFHFLKINYTPVIIKFNNDYNYHDIKYALEFCKNKKIEPLIVDIDFDEFVKSGKLYDICESMKSSIHHRAVTAYVCSKLDGTVICGDGEPYLRINETNNDWDLKIFQHDYSIVNYFIDNKIYGTPHFNRYTPQMMRSFLEDQRIQQLVNNQIPGKLGSDSSKLIVYNRHSNFYIQSRPKFHGYETIEKSEIFKHDSFYVIKESFKKWDGVYKENYHKLMERICMQ